MFIELKSISKFYQNGDKVVAGLSDVALSFDCKEFVVITGESGSGKSTLLNILSGTDNYNSGDLLIDGESTEGYREEEWQIYRKERISLVYQDFQLIDDFTVFGNIEIAYNLNNSEVNRKDNINKLIAKVGLSKETHKKVKYLSGGEKQRVAIARALAKGTNIILADEPTGNLDSQNAQAIVNLLKDIAEDKLVIVVTHNEEQFKSVTTREIRLSDGKVIYDKDYNKLKSPIGNNQIGKIEKIDDIEIQKDKIAISDAQNANIIESKTNKPQGNINKDLLVNLKKIAKSVIKTTKECVSFGAKNAFAKIGALLSIILSVIIVASCVLLLYSSLNQEQSLPIYPTQNHVYNNVIRERVILSKYDDSLISDEELNMFARDRRVNYIKTESIVLDKLLHRELINIYDQYERYQNYRIYSLSMLNKEITCGISPQEDDEVIISTSNGLLFDSELTYTDQGVFGEYITLNQYYQFNLEDQADSICSLKIVGIVKGDNPYEFGIYISDAMFNKLYLQSLNIGSIYNFSTLDISFASNLIVDERVGINEIYVSEQVSNYFEWGNNSELLTDFKITTKMFESESISVNVSRISDSYEIYDEVIAINPVTYNLMINNKFSEISIYLNSEDDVNAFINFYKIPYNIIYPNAYSPIEYFDASKFLNEIFYTIVCCVVGAILIICNVSLIRSILRNKQKNYAVYRALGYGDKKLKIIIVIENAITILCGIIPTIILAMVIIVIYPINQDSPNEYNIFVNLTNTTILNICALMYILYLLRLSKVLFKKVFKNINTVLKE